MILSRYCKIYPDADDDAQFMLFSTRTTSVICVSHELIKDIEKNKLTEEEQKTLVDLGFLVQSEHEEKREMLRYIDDLNAENRTFTATVVLNLDCNLGCKYCFEGTRKGKFYMSVETADDFIEFVKSRDLANKEEINIIFYGGEPLLSIDIIRHISEKVRTIAEDKKITFTFSLITNGTLLTQRVVEQLKPLGLRAASITLDGPRDVHDAFRPFKSGKGSFDAIIENIKSVSGTMDVQVGGNYTGDYYREFPRLLDFLLEKGLTPDRISSVQFDPVMSETGEFAPPDFHGGCMSFDEPWVVDASVFLREAIFKRGFRTQMLTTVTCAVELRENLVVNFDGALYKCTGFLNRKDYCTGSVKTGENNYRRTYCLGHWKNEECFACGYLPLCFGGCRYMKLVRDGNVRGVDCKKQYLDAILEKLVLQDIQYGL